MSHFTKEKGAASVAKQNAAPNKPTTAITGRECDF